MTTISENELYDMLYIHISVLLYIRKKDYKYKTMCGMNNVIRTAIFSAPTTCPRCLQAIKEVHDLHISE